MEFLLIVHGSEQYLQMVSLRTEVLRKPLGLVYTESQLESEKSDLLLGAFENGQIIGCCILTPIENNQIQLRQMAVENGSQGKGIGAELIRFAEKITQEKGFDSIMMHARKSAIGFYQKLDYQIVGEEFHEVSIPHFVMEKNLNSK
ncbi:MAG: GNAT family N-acetyltransferase [Bacteroidota bacterium]